MMLLEPRGHGVDGGRIPERMQKAQGPPLEDERLQRFQNDEAPCDDGHQQKDDEESLREDVRMAEKVAEADCLCFHEYPSKTQARPALARPLPVRRARDAESVCGKWL